MKPKLLFITSQYPELSGGSQVRNYYMLEYLRKIYTVSICCVSDHDDTHNDIYSIQKLSLLERIACVLRGNIPYIERYRNSVPLEKLIAMVQKADICFFSELNGYFIAERGLINQNKQLILDAHNVDYIKFIGETTSRGLIHTILGGLLAPIVKRIEAKVISRMDMVFTCSQQDKDVLQKLAPATRILVVPNGVDCEKFTPNNGKPDPNSLLFMGSLGDPPNDDGIKYFLEKIYPLLKQKVPKVSITITGRGAKEWLLQYAKKDTSVKLKGFVPDVREHINAAAVCICPLRFGSGTRLKILEYMAMGKPVVSTKIGAEGIQLKDNETVCLADTPKAFADKIITLLNDPVLAKKIGHTARKTICELYDWETIISGAVGEMQLL